LTSEKFNDGGQAQVQRNNVWKYLEKRHLAKQTVQDNLLNLSKCLIEDPYNEQWTLGYNFEDETVFLKNSETDEKFDDLRLPNTGKLRPLLALIIDECLATSGLRTPYNLTELPKGFFPFIHPNNKKEHIMSDAAEVASKRAKIIGAFNDWVQEATNWRIRELISNKGCNEGCIKIAMGPISNDAEELPESVVDELKVELAAVKKELASIKTRLDKLEER